MASDNPFVVLGLVFVVILEVAYLIYCNGEQYFKFFRYFMDIVVTLTIISGIYFAFRYFRATEKIPKRSLEVVPPNKAREKVAEETARQIELLMKSKEFQDFQARKR